MEQKLRENRFRWIILILSFIFTLVILWFVFIYSLTLKKQADRVCENYTIENDLIELVKQKTDGVDNPKDIIDVCSDIATNHLTFSKSNYIQAGKANCVGYARLTSSLLNYAFKANNLNYRAKPIVGTVYSFGINLNDVAQSILPISWRPFFKNHDFVEVSLPHSTIYVDTSLQDLTGRKFTIVQSH